ncbi:unnamed protein product, partial [marine sediment metagenome]
MIFISAYIYAANWAYVQTIGSINFLSSIYFINNDTGYACGQGVSTSAEII